MTNTAPDPQHTPSQDEQAPFQALPRRLPKTAIVGALLLVLVGGLLLMVNTVGNKPRPGGCARNMRQIALAALIYAHDNKGIFPETPAQLLLTQDITSHVFICPSTNHTPADGTTPAEIAANLTAGGHLSYIYCAQGFPSGDMKDLPGDYIVVTEPLTNHEGDGINVAFSDGHGEWFGRSEARDILDLVNSGVRPVRWPALTATVPTTQR